MRLAFLKTRIGLSLIAALLIIFGAVFFKIKNSSPSQNKIAKEVSVIADSSVKNAIESGEISEKPWEEVLRGLGSTTVDQNTRALNQDNSSSTEKELTATDRFARIFLEKYINLKKNGAVNEQTGTNLINQLLAQDYGSEPEEKVYTENDLTLLDSNSLSVLKKYGNDLGKAIQVPIPQGYEHELILISHASDTGSSEGLDKLALNIARYQKIRENIESIAVPESLKTSHLAILNSLSSIIEGIRGMTVIEQDPVGATKMVARYKDGISSLELPLAQIRTYLKKMGISYASYESGYILMK